MINIDTILMEKAVKEMNSACASVDRAMAAINEVNQHNDWHCKERQQINEANAQIRKNIAKLRDYTYGFSRALQETSNDFKNQENAIIRSFQSVSAQIGDALTIVKQSKISSQSINDIAKKLKINLPTVKWLNLERIHCVDLIEFPKDN